MVFIEKCQRAVMRILLLEVAKIDVYSKVIVEHDCNRMRQSLVYDCVKTAKYSR